MSDMLSLPFSVPHPIIMHKVYINSVRFGQTFGKLRAPRWKLCDPPLNSQLHPCWHFWKFNTSSTEVIWGWGLMCPCLTLKSTLRIWMGRTGLWQNVNIWWHEHEDAVYACWVSLCVGGWLFLLIVRRVSDPCLLLWQPSDLSMHILPLS